MHESAVHRDLTHARTRILHGLYVANHATMVAVRERGHDLRRDPSIEIRPFSLGPTLNQNLVNSADRWVARLAATERTLAIHVAPCAGVASQRHSTSADDDPGRVERALTRWDIQAHRTLARDPSPANIYLVCRAQVVIANLASHIDPGRPPTVTGCTTDPPLLADYVRSSQRTWSALADRWHDLVLPQQRLDPSLAAVAGELRTAISAVGGAHNGDAIVAGKPTRRVIGQTICAAAELAEVVGDLSVDKALRGPAGPLSRRALDEAAREIEQGIRPDVDTVWVGPEAVIHKSVVTLPEPVARSLQRAADDARSSARQLAAQMGTGVICQHVTSGPDPAPTTTTAGQGPARRRPDEEVKIATQPIAVRDT